MCSLQCRSPFLLAGQDNAVGEGSKTQSLFVIQILYKPCCCCSSVVPFILWLGISVSAHTKNFSAPAGCKGMRWTRLPMSVTQHKAIAARRKHKGPTSAEQIHGSPLLLAAPSPAGWCQGEDDHLPGGASDISYQLLLCDIPTLWWDWQGQAQPCRNLPLSLLASSPCACTVLEDKITLRLFMKLCVEYQLGCDPKYMPLYLNGREVIRKCRCLGAVRVSGYNLM